VDESSLVSNWNNNNNNNNNNEWKLIFADATIPEIVVNSMTRHLNSKRIALVGCEAIRNLACHEQISREFGKMFACELLASVLKLHRSVQDIVHVCVEAMSELCISHKENGIVLGCMDNCVCLLEVLNDYIENSFITKELLVTIGNIAECNRNNKNNFLKLNGCELIVHVILKYKNENEVLNIANDLFWYLSNSDISS